MLVGLVGKPNVGKSTFFSAATKAPAEIANYPFTTIKPNRGMAFARFSPCPHTLIGVPCTPRTGLCADGVRLVPVEMLDVAGLVPGAHEGKGLGNQFLDDLRQADALIHVLDASGSTDAEGNPVARGTHDPVEDVRFLERELDHWIAGILTKGHDRWSKAVMQKADKLERVLLERLTGLGVSEPMIVAAMNRAALGQDPTKWTPEEILAFAGRLREASKPVVLAANKADVADAATLQRLQALPGHKVVPVCAEAELALRRASDAGLVDYVPGASTFTVKEPGKLNAAQAKALERIRVEVLERFGSTGVQKLVEVAVYEELERIVAFPVEDETHLTDKEGRVLPDAHFLRKGSTAKDLAYRVHTELGDHFIRAINVRTKRTVGADYEVQHGDVIRIVAGK